MDRKKRILIVDDDEHIRKLLETLLKSIGHLVEVASDGIEAIALMNLDIDLVLLDIYMEGMDGFDVARKIRQNETINNDIPIIMMTASGNHEDRIRAVQAGADDFISKPLDLTEIQVRLEAHLLKKYALDALKEHQNHLEEEVEHKTEALRASVKELANAHRGTQQAYIETISHLAVVAEFKDVDTASHIGRVSAYCSLLADGLKLTPREKEIFVTVSPMHDVGKIGIPEHILLKPGKLDDKEMEIMKEHVNIGGRILNGSSSSLIQGGEIVALTHHEKWDGSGYPKGLKGNEIHQWGRICAVADVFDALTSVRPYKIAFSSEKAFEIIGENMGSHFDPEIAEVFLNNKENVLKIQKKFEGM
ncbi:MAG: response regulator [Nitrospinaceae bacterium]|jgi:putative two-component system response regulator|nr:response regulator [Nitrospinaceae bacterium]MBT3434875.1 response regulator [Nitrospinaceae bacterium]MBT3820984.1 response regulator [Nitrospinaceae bacterium]MBT4093314.1 response regulator [Nitrospinaceae bacterium]MBT4431928.1 response regulator [Nitrospinaceae bacterium]